MYRSTSLFQLMLFLLKASLVFNYPITSEPLKNNPEHWGEGSWQIYDHRHASLPYKSSLILSKAKKITAKSIFIIPDCIVESPVKVCQSGFKIDDNGKCIKVVNINKDDIIASQLQQIFSGAVSNEKNYDYEDYYEKADNESPKKDETPIRFNLPMDQEIKQFVKLDTPDPKMLASVTISSHADIQNNLVVTTSHQNKLVLEAKTFDESLIQSTTESISTLQISKTTLINQRNRTQLMQQDKRPSMFVLKNHKTVSKNRTLESITKLNRLNMLTRTNKLSHKKNVSTITTSKPFAWLPKGWQIHQNSSTPMLLKFWSEMPLVQDGSTIKILNQKDSVSHKRQKFRRVNSHKPKKSKFNNNDVNAGSKSFVE